MERSLHPPLRQHSACALATHAAPQSCARGHQHPSSGSHHRLGWWSGVAQCI